jgi:lactoylglutathione lyase
MEVGNQIQKLRLDNNLTQEQLAEKLSVSRQSVSKWELSQSIPELEVIIAMSKLFDVSTDELLLGSEERKRNYQQLHLGSIYLIVKDFEKSIRFYEKLLSMKVSTRNCGDKFAEFFFDNKCLALMNEKNLHDHNNSAQGDYKFVLNFWVDDLTVEYKRLKNLNIGELTDIIKVHDEYYYVHLRDPDNNVIEITGKYEG